MCIKEYGYFLTEENDFDFVYHEEWKMFSIMKRIEMNDKKNNVKTFFDVVTTYNENRNHYCL